MSGSQILVEGDFLGLLILVAKSVMASARFGVCIGVGLTPWNGFIGDWCGPGDGGSSVTGLGSGIGDMVSACHTEASMIVWRVPAQIEF